MNGTYRITKGVSPFDFGAVGDGSADDTAAVQAAFTANQGSVSLYGKSFKTTSTITMPNDRQTLYGHGGTIDAQFFTNAPAIRMQKNNQSVIGTKITGADGRKTTGNIHDRGILYEAVDTPTTAAFNGQIIGNEISNQGGDAICVVGFTASTIQGNYLHDCYGQHRCWWRYGHHC
jgi:hypothetical protein